MTRYPATEYLQQHLDALQSTIGEGNAKRGFHDEGDTFRTSAANARSVLTEILDRVGFDVESDDAIEAIETAAGTANAALRNYYMTKLALIHSEVTEAVEELRNGRSVDETWYDYGAVTEADAANIRDGLTPAELELKPEGVPSEVADIVIRCFDFADEAGFSLGEIILEKLAFNATRGRMHGGKRV